MISIFNKEPTGMEFNSFSYEITFCFIVNTWSKNFQKSFSGRKQLFQTLTLKRTLFQGNYSHRTRLVTCSTCKTCLVFHSTQLTTCSAHYIRLPTRNTRLSTCSIRFSIRMSIRSTCLSTCSICLSTCSTLSINCRSFYNWSSELFKSVD